MRKLLLAFACLALASCGLQNMPGIGTASDIAAEKLATTSADEKLFDALTSSLTVAANSSTLLASAGVVKPGSPQALRIATLLDNTRDAINRAYAIWKGTVTGDRAAAMAEVEAAFNTLSAELTKWSPKP